MRGAGPNRLRPQSEKGGISRLRKPSVTRSKTSSTDTSRLSFRAKSDHTNSSFPSYCGGDLGVGSSHARRSFTGVDRAVSRPAGSGGDSGGGKKRGPGNGCNRYLAALFSCTFDCREGMGMAGELGRAGRSQGSGTVGEGYDFSRMTSGSVIGRMQARAAIRHTSTLARGAGAFKRGSARGSY